MDNWLRDGRWRRHLDERKAAADEKDAATQRSLVQVAEWIKSSSPTCRRLSRQQVEAVVAFGMVTPAELHLAGVAISSPDPSVAALWEATRPPRNLVPPRPTQGWREDGIAVAGGGLDPLRIGGGAALRGTGAQCPVRRFAGAHRAGPAKQQSVSNTL